MTVLARSSPPSQNRWRYPTSCCAFETPVEAARRLIAGGVRPEIPFLTADSVVLTQGSCFSGNITRALQKYDVRCVHADFVELNNTTFHNLFLIELALRSSPLTDEELRFSQEILRGVTLDEFSNLLHSADVFIFTIGVALCPLDEDGDLFMPFEIRGRARRLQMTTPERNAENMRRILSMIAAVNPTAKFVLTVSPVPLGGVPRDFPSAFAADCVSKSVMRTAAHYIETDRIPNLWYWPSFEMVRWLGGHTAPVYGVDDDNPRHVSQARVDMIVRLFIENFGDIELRRRLETADGDAAI